MRPRAATARRRVSLPLLVFVLVLAAPGVAQAHVGVWTTNTWRPVLNQLGNIQF